MYTLNFDEKITVHFMGIGGISMSGLAEILLSEGFTVQGSDMSESDIVKALIAKGAKVYIGQKKENITSNIDLVVYTAAIREDNEEFQAAKEAGIPMLTRAELLGQIMDFYKYSIAVAGTHGKTTTTSLLSHIFMEAEKDPTISIGGILDLIGGNIRVGKSPYFITEACEYTNSYHSFKPYISIILNIDNDHLDFFRNIENIIESFRVFATKLKPEGILIINGDMEYTERVTKGLERRIITFGMKDGNTYQARDITLNALGHPSYDLYKEGKFVTNVSLSVTGIHNAVNSLSAIAAADVLGVDMASILEGLKKCSSAKRRFEYKGTLPNGVTVVDDYAHHPTEIAATLTVAKEIAKGDVWVAFQPHTYSRTAALLPDFAKALSIADHIMLADIYAAREKDNGTISSMDIEKLLRDEGKDCVYLGAFSEIEKYFLKNSKENDLLITMGAGNIVNLGENLLRE